MEYLVEAARLSCHASQRTVPMLRQVPTSFDDMFRFNAAVMGMADRDWMYEVLDCFDAIVRNIANSFRLQELEGFAWASS